MARENNRKPCPSSSATLVSARDWWRYDPERTEGRSLLISRFEARRPKALRSDSRGLVRQNGQVQAIVISGLGIADRGLRFLKLGLTQFNNGTESQLIA